jgi:hypothetical protein
MFAKRELTIRDAQLLDPLAYSDFIIILVSLSKEVMMFIVYTLLVFFMCF